MLSLRKLENTSTMTCFSLFPEVIKGFEDDSLARLLRHIVWKNQFWSRPEWKINKAIAIKIATYTRKMSVVNHLQIIEVYFEGWIQRLKSFFFSTHTHKPTKSKTKPKNRIKTDILLKHHSQIIGVYGSWKFDTSEEIWFSILHCRETYCLHYFKCEIWLLQLTLMLSHRSIIITI